MISDEDEEEYNTRSSRSRRRVSFMSSTSSTSSSVTSYSATSRQLIDRLTDHLALYHAAASAEGRQREKQIGGDRKVNGEEKVSKVLPQALVWFHSMKMEDKRKILTIADETFATICYEVVAERTHRGCEDLRFQVLGELLETKEKGIQRRSKAGGGGGGGGGEKKNKSKSKKKNAKNAKKGKKKIKSIASGSSVGEKQQQHQHEKKNRSDSVPAAGSSSVSDALCWKKSTDVYNRLMNSREEERALEAECYLFTNTAAAAAAAATSQSHFNCFSVNESLLSDAERFNRICGKVSLGRFLSSSESAASKNQNETEWLLDMGYYTLAAFIVSKFELLILKHFRSHNQKSHLSSQMQSSSSNAINRRDTLPEEQQELCEKLSRICLLRELRQGPSSSSSNNKNKREGMESVLSRLLLLKRSHEHSMVTSGRFYISNKADRVLDAMLLRAELLSLKVIAERNEMLLLEQVDFERETQLEDDERRKKKSSEKRKKKKNKKKKLREEEAQTEALELEAKAHVVELEMAEMKEEKEVEMEEGRRGKQKDSEDRKVDSDPSDATNPPAVYRMKEQSLDEGSLKTEEEDRWLEAFVPEVADSFSWANIFGTQAGASFYWSSGDLTDGDGSESWTSSLSTRQDLVLGSLLSDLGDRQKLEKAPVPNLRLPLIKSEVNDETASMSDEPLGRSKAPRSETNSPRFERVRRLSHAERFSSTNDSGVHSSKSMGRWLMQRRSSEVLLLSRAEPANSATSFFMTTAPPRSLLRTMLNAFGPPLQGSPYLPEYLERKSFWQERKSDHPFLEALNKDIKDFVDRNQESVSRHTDFQRQAMKHILAAIHVIWPRARAKVFGSVAAGLSLPGSDMDIVVWLPPVRMQNIMESEVGILESGNSKESFVQQLSRQLESHACFRHAAMIEKTAIPILKIEYVNGSGPDNEEEFHCSIDISFQNKEHKGLLATAVVRELIGIFPSLRPAFLVIKAFLQSQKMSKAYTGGLSSYCLVLVISSFLIHQEKDSSVGEILLDFVHFFGSNHQNISEFSFSLSKGIDRMESRTFDPLFVEDPLQPGKNAAQNCFRIYPILRALPLLLPWLRSQSSEKDK